MNRPWQADRLNVKAFAQDAQHLEGSASLQKMERLAQELTGLEADLTVNWQAAGEMRQQKGLAGTDDAIWLHLQAEAVLPLTCQRCMGVLREAVKIDHWYRFVATEDIAMAEDDESEEDLLVLEPQFDLLTLLEDELLMALPLVPMHEQCPETSRWAAGVADRAEPAPDKPNPFAVLSQLKKK